MEIGKEILIAIITSAVVTGLLVFVIKQYIAKWFAHEFEKKNTMLDHRLRTAEKVDTNFISHQLGIYPEVLELTYRIRNIIREGVRQEYAFDWDANLRPLCAQLTEDLYKFRFYLAEDVFEPLHEFKHIAQDAVLLVDTHTREKALFDQEAYSRRVSDFEGKVRDADELFSTIRELIEAKMLSIQELK